MNSWLDHLLVVPIVLPMIVGGLMLLLGDRRRTLRVSLNVLSTPSLLGVAIAILLMVDAGHAGGPWPESLAVYLVSNWSAPFGISLVADRLTALMLVLASLLSLCSLIYATARWDKAGVHFHPLFQFLLMGVNGAFLTGDIFNLFVFFEILLAASYGLVMHGSGGQRVKAGMHYIAINLLASSMFLVGVALIYGVTGTLNMADLARKVPLVASDDRALLEAGAAILAVAFLAKSAMWPLNFWLPPAYSAASPPVAAVFAILSKVGIYAVLRIWFLLFGEAAGSSAGFGSYWLLYGGLVTLAIGSIGLLASQELPRLASFSLIVSSGTLLAAISFGQPGITSGALLYMVSSTLAIGAFFLLAELIDRTQVFGANVLALTMEAFQAEGAIEDTESDEVGVVIPMAMAFLGLAFITCALVITGLPPLSGFFAKFALLSAAINPGGLPSGNLPGPHVWALVTLVILSGLAALIALSRVGIRVFWSPAERAAPRLRLIEVGPIAVMLGTCVLLVLGLGPAMQYLDKTAAALHAPQGYSKGVLIQPRVPSPTSGDHQ